MKLRWASYKNKVTAEQVRAYATEYEIPLMLAKKELTDSRGPVLQYLDESDTWVDVPLEVIERCV